MYFAFGQPRVFTCEENEVLVGLEYSQDKSMFVTISRKSIHLWVDKPRAVVSSVTRSLGSLQSHGENINVFFKPDSSLIAVVTSKHYIMIYDGIFHDELPEGRILEFEFKAPHPYMKGPGEGDGVPGHLLNHTETFFIESGIECIMSQYDLLCVSTSKGSLQCIQWTGILDENESLFLSDVYTPGSEIDCNISAKDLCYDILTDCYVAVLSDSTIFKFTRKELEMKDGSSSRRGTFAANCNDAVCVNVSSKYQFVVVGCKSGDVKVFSTDKDSWSLSLSHILCLKTHNALYESLGSVSSVVWSPDSNAIAVGYDDRGFCIWSTFGRLLFCSAIDQYILDDLKSHKNQFGLLGVKALDWGNEGYELLTLFKNYRESSPGNGLVFQFSFVKSAGCSNPTLNNQGGCILHGTDRIYSYFPNTEDPDKAWIRGDVESLCDISWKVNKISNTYLVDNWPIRFIDINSKKDIIAIAGKRGFAIFYVKKQKWRLFRNEYQEREFQCQGGLVWYEHYLIVPCWNERTNKNELRIYDCSGSINNSAIVEKYDLEDSVVICNIYNNYIIVMTADRRLHIYTITKQDSSLTIQQSKSIKMAAYLNNCSCVTFIALSPLTFKPGAEGDCGPNPKSLILNCGGVLKLIELEIADLTSWTELRLGGVMTIADAVETVFMPDTTRENLEASNGLIWSMFLSTRMGGTKLWVPVVTESGRRRFMIPFQLNVIPLCVYFTTGIVLGVITEPSLDIVSDHQSFPHLLFEHKTQFFLNHLYNHLVRRNELELAFKFASEHAALPYFSHSLELMLHELLEDESDFKPADPLLPKVISFLRQFPQFLEVIAHCARKSEASLWEFLFSQIGDPKTLFEKCIQEYRFHTASSYLVIIQTLHPIEVSTEYAGRLLDAALANYQWKLANELIRFLGAIANDNKNQLLPDPQKHPNPIAAVEIISVDEKKKTRTVSTQTDTVDNSEMFDINVLLSRCARLLISQQRLRALANFSMHLRFPLQLWLTKERNRAAKVEDYIEAFSSLIQQFRSVYRLELNSLAPVIRRKSVDDTAWATADGEREHITSEKEACVSPAQSAFKNADERAIAIQELRHLLDICLISRCYDWTVLISTFLKSSTTLKAALYFSKIDSSVCQREQAIRRGLLELSQSSVGKPWSDFLSPFVISVYKTAG